MKESLNESNGDRENVSVTSQSVLAMKDCESSLHASKELADRKSQSLILSLGITLSGLHALRGWPIILTFLTGFLLMTWFVLRHTKLREVRELRYIPYSVLLISVMYSILGWLLRSIG
jgi:hypothetical protein